MADIDAQRVREVRLFRNNRSQAVRIPAEFELPGDGVRISRDGDRLILEPVRRSTGLLDRLAAWAPIDDAFPEIADPPAGPDDVF
ncbi:antitoxin [Methylobrevis pamukkalensis]|uniref:SpoVT / AbrB like domain protein n=1 Tax=Methylobrevis pamukkalensis TaxID=1439726 RepID=A0A1E3GQJ9_9HYPH|nr:AbrB/MazE/SpoVT family DNA-binding domain-containing protein [Methylobrevis pamukkalensis]ODN66215.1 SpoVT / AbrB like domain protein [Methylobrevis pamukkalensis]